MFTRETIASANTTIKTIDVKGKPYAPVSEKVKAFRLISPGACLETEVVAKNEQGMLIKATVKDEGGIPISTGHAYESKGSSQVNTSNALENSETSAVGRALENAGISLRVRTKGSSLAEVNADIKTIEVKGKAYPEVSERIAAFRTLYPAGRIETAVEDFTGQSVTFVARVYDGEGALLATGRASEIKSKDGINALNFVENCETSAIGRALSFAGFGIAVSIASAEEMKYAETLFSPATEEQMAEIKELEAKQPKKTIDAVWKKYCPSKKDLDSFNADKIIQTYKNCLKLEEEKKNSGETIMSAVTNYT